MMLKNRKSGILLHISSLPSKHGIGDLGEQAYHFIDKLEQMGQVYWQILPTNEPNGNNSPYDTSSAFAQNPMFISLDLLIEDGLLDNSDFNHTLDLDSSKIDFDRLKKWKFPLLLKAAKTFQKTHKYNHNNEFVVWSWSCQESAFRFYMCNLAVFPEHRRKGLYTMLMNEMVERATKLGFQEIYCCHTAANNAVIISKLKAGFVITSMEITDSFGALVNFSFLGPDDK